jgi:hypothetical protein
MCNNNYYILRKKFPKNNELWEKLTGQMFEHSQGEQVTGYVCPVYACPKRCFMENNRDEKKTNRKIKKNFDAEFVNLNFIEPYFTTKCTSHNEDYHNAL